MKLVYTETAISDLIRLRAFIGEHDPAAAQRIGAELIERIEALHTFPMMGRPVPSAPTPDAIRDMAFGNYHVRYATHAETIAILRVWHHYENRE
jgi:plasmid stabilization system protein ParE